MNNPKALTNAYLFMLAHTDLDSRTYTEIESFLREKLDSCSSDKSEKKLTAERIKALLIDKLASIPGVDKISILDESSFQLSTSGLRVNGAGPATILVIDEGGE